MSRACTVCESFRNHWARLPGWIRALPDTCASHGGDHSSAIEALKNQERADLTRRAADADLGR